jgi:hypothetical protein
MTTPLYDRLQFSFDDDALEIYCEASTLRFPVSTHDWPRAIAVTGLGVFEMDSAEASQAHYTNGSTGVTAIIWND